MQTNSTYYFRGNFAYNWRDWGGWGGEWFNRNGGDIIGAWYALYAITGSISDINYKKDITPLPYGLDDIMKINPIKYKYNLPRESMLSNDPDYFLGFSAQEMQTIAPETVHVNMMTDNEESEMKGSLAITPNEIIPIVVNGIKQLNEKLELMY
jgi:hypothetical protein